MLVEIRRIEKGDDGIVGVLLIAGKIHSFTLEDPWNGNQPFASCIPAGSYTCRRIISPHFGETFEICDVPGRDHILFHWGNTEADTQGCVLVGQQVGGLGGRRAVLNSKAAFRGMFNLLHAVDSFPLLITEDFRI